ncbi:MULTISPECIES: VOC family protein [Ramlibacter]|uniref:VOC family protein n=1 Tax=Ramlibacter aquaticus TaxID=2780094 RepID=A0ABR9SIC0_9BURK|nr:MULTISPECIES: VOC family protein [Ramlibacter]MBE7942087.1 VOC family protein [Ramlibacter aquaticus]
MNPVVHFEFPYEDRARIARFYEQAFGWKLQMLGPEMGHYVVAVTAESDAGPRGVRGAINGGFFQRQPGAADQVPSVVIAVDDLADARARVREAGGELLGEPMPIPGVGQYASFRDTEGNRVSLLQPLPMA